LIERIDILPWGSTLDTADAERNPDSGRARLVQVFQFLEAWNRVEHPPKRLLNEQRWLMPLRGLPDHRSIILGSGSNPESTEPPSEDVILRVGRPEFKPAPAPPQGIAEWLQRGWEEPDGDIHVKPSRTEIDAEKRTILVNFDDNPDRPASLEEWTLLWGKWAANERIVRKAALVYERLYSLHGEIEREAGRFELIVGDGLLSWKPRGKPEINHPIIFQRVELRFNPKVPEFIIEDSGREVEFYTSLLQTIPEVNGQAIAQCLDELKNENESFRPLDGVATSAFLQRLLARIAHNGEFSEQEAARVPSGIPRIVRAPFLFLRERSIGLAQTIARVIEDLKTRLDLPRSLQEIVGAPPSIERGDPNGGSSQGTSLSTKPADILFSKPANAEQMRIAQRLEQHGSVVVQGPPGTGKTHTIANLIGHLLARGERVLVTSHTPKALRVLREQVVEPLRPLCVSVLESTLDSNNELKASVDEIIRRLSDPNTEEARREAEYLQHRREQLRSDLERARSELAIAVNDEYRDVVVAGKGYSPSDAARLVAEGVGRDEWVPPGVKPGAPLPLNSAEFDKLYRAANAVSAADEVELARPLPNLQELIQPDRFDALMERQARLAKADLTIGAEFWETEPGFDGADRLDELAKRVSEVVAKVEDGRPWKLDAIDSGRLGDQHREFWDDLLGMIDEACKTYDSTRLPLKKHAPELPLSPDVAEQKTIVRDIMRHLEHGRKLGAFLLLRKPSWKAWIGKARVKGASPTTSEHFRALDSLIDLKLSRRALLERWDHQMAPLGAPHSEEVNADYPEEFCRHFVRTIPAFLAWHADQWGPIESEFAAIGFRWYAFLAQTPPILANHGELLRLRDAARDSLPFVLKTRVNAIRWNRLKKLLKDLNHVLNSSGGCAPAQVVHKLREAVAASDPVSYREHFSRLEELHRLQSDLTLRDHLLSRLEPVASAWAAVIRDKHVNHSGGSPPGDHAAAWLWRQCEEELNRRAEKSLEKMQRTIERLEKELRSVTASLIERLAWASQPDRVTPEQRKALNGWLKTILKMGKGHGKRVPMLLKEAAKLMTQCREAVPVWIMPLAAVYENFDPRKTRFDVLILDEASQSNALALIAMSMAHKVVIVGDDQQVTPSAVGEKIEPLDSLINQHLQGIPLKHLFDGKTSVYDLAVTAFGGRICLREHFRCVKDIINFSNQLSYNGMIEPLRDATGVKLTPHVIAHRVEAMPTDGKVNLVEAKTAAALLVGATEHPAYDGKTFGVISLLGDEQAREIERVLKQRLTPEEYVRRRILCGNPAQFQGDERHVMFLSMVHTPTGGPLRLSDGDDMKKRFNVAASRAQDQMWVVHSLNPQVDLKPGDLRLRLIEHAEDPTAIARQVEKVTDQAESEFEKQVGERLIRAGFRVKGQWKVGAYRIDLVVEGTSGRLAVECDGDRYHTPDNRAADEERQAILERLGWTFARIRGTKFFRDPEKSMAPIFERLRTLGIEPGQETGDQNLKPSSDLKDSVIRRAEELLREWAADEAKSEGNEARHEESRGRRAMMHSSC
jgi:very-short-patch-repair endonuclease